MANNLIEVIALETNPMNKVYEDLPKDDNDDNPEEEDALKVVHVVDSEKAIRVVKVNEEPNDNLYEGYVNYQQIVEIVSNNVVNINRIQT